MAQTVIVIVGSEDRARLTAIADGAAWGMWGSKAERALFTRRRKDIYEAIHPETRHGGDRGASRKIGDTARFTADTATRTGRSERDVQRDATRDERIDEDGRAQKKESLPPPGVG